MAVRGGFEPPMHFRTYTLSRRAPSTKSGIDAAGNKVTNVADGDLNANSKDAVNGSQLFATNQNVCIKLLLLLTMPKPLTICRF